MYNGKSVLVIIQARMGSTRLPGKVLMPLAGQPVLSHITKRLQASAMIDQIVVATSTLPADDVIKEWGDAVGIGVYRGSEPDVLARYYECAQTYPAEIICRVTGDCPLVDYRLIEAAIALLVDNGYDYITMDNSIIPRGVHGEVFTADVLRKVYAKATEAYQREHVTYYIYEDNDADFNWTYLASESWLKRDYRLTLDTPEDYELLSNIFNNLYVPHRYLELKQVIDYLDANPQVATINCTVQQKPVK